MPDPLIIVGTGEMAGVIARGFLKLGRPIFPVTRSLSMSDLAASAPQPERVLVAVGEDDLQPVLAAIPPTWRERLILLQNELLPRDWEKHGIAQPTVISVWFEKKKGQEAKVLLPSPIFGPGAELLSTALGALDLPTRILPDRHALLFELVAKNLYILTTNICGLVTGGNVAELWQNHRDLALAVAEEVMDIQAWLTGVTLDRPRLLKALTQAIASDPAHNCMGRSAPQRLSRAVGHADTAGLCVPRLRGIRAES